jgi:hypothetical protein
MRNVRTAFGMLSHECPACGTKYQFSDDPVEPHCITCKVPLAPLGGGVVSLADARTKRNRRKDDDVPK